MLVTEWISNWFKEIERIVLKREIKSLIKPESLIKISNISETKVKEKNQQKKEIENKMEVPSWNIQCIEKS
ncbi:27475_t:CDS:2, partial [Gigaspora margarita]